MSRGTLVLGESAMARRFLETEARRLGLEPISISPVHRAFRPMTEDTAFDVSELAIVTAIQAAEAGRDVIALPIAVASRFQHKCLVQNANFGDLGPGDLQGKRIAVRSYSQTTGTWVRTILDTEYGVSIPGIEWLTQEAPHVIGAPEPDFVLRDPDGASPVDLLREGKVAAAIFGNDMPTEDWVRPVIADPEAASSRSFESNGVVHINHIIAIARPTITREPRIAQELASSFERIKAKLTEKEQSLLPIGREQMRASVETLLGSVHRQGLTQRRLSFDDVFGEGADLMAQAG